MPCPIYNYLLIIVRKNEHITVVELLKWRKMDAKYYKRSHGIQNDTKATMTTQANIWKNPDSTKSEALAAQIGGLH